MEKDQPRTNTVLIVDDDEATAELLEEVLNGEPGFRAVSVNDANRALEIIRSTRVDLVLLDVLMPGINGLELQAMLRDNPVTRHIPVIFVTAKTNAPELSEQHTATVLEKPFDLDTLLSTVGATLATYSTGTG